MTNRRKEAGNHHMETSVMIKTMGDLPGMLSSGRRKKKNICVISIFSQSLICYMCTGWRTPATWQHTETNSLWNCHRGISFPQVSPQCHREASASWIFIDYTSLTIISSPKSYLQPTAKACAPLIKATTETLTSLLRNEKFPPEIQHKIYIHLLW